MSWKEFIVQMSGQLAWPLTVLVIIFALKDKLEALLPRIEKLKHKDTEISFSKVMEEIVEQASEIEEEGLPLSRGLQNEEYRLRKLIDIASNRVLHQAFGLVDRELLIIDNFYSGKDRAPIKFKDGRKIRNKAGISEEFEKKIKNLQYIRNRAMNNRAQAIPEDQILSFIDLSIHVTLKLREFIANKKIQPMPNGAG